MSHFRERKSKDECVELRRNFLLFTDNQYKGRYAKRAECPECGMKMKDKIEQLSLHLLKCPGSELRKPTSKETLEHFRMTELPGLYEAECLNCHTVKRSTYRPNLIRHLSACPDPARTLTDSWYKMGERRCYSCKENILHSEFIKHRNICPRVMILCYRCGGSVSRGSTAEHLKLCRLKFFRCSSCMTRGLLLNNKEKHKKSCSFSVCQHCSKIFRRVEMGSHGRICERWLCRRCNTRMPRADRYKHDCKYRSCKRCKKYLLLPSHEFAAHERNCTIRICRCCNDRMNRDDFEKHKENCTFRVCSGCRTYFAPHESARHGENCLFRICGRCNGKISRDDVEKHLSECFVCKFCKNPDAHRTRYHQCSTKTCSGCKRRIALDKLDEHCTKCESKPCRKCNTILPNLLAFEAHRMNCIKKRCENIEQQRGLKQKLNNGIWRSKRSKADSSENVQHANARWLNEDTFPLCASIMRVMEVWTKKPRTVAVADFEYASGILDINKHEAVFEIAVADANGDWIVRPTSINHRISQQELWERYMAAYNKYHDQGTPELADQKRASQRLAIFRANFAKYYGGGGGSQLTVGRTWEEIAGEIDEHTKVLVHSQLVFFRTPVY